MNKTIKINNHEIKLTNLDKVIWPEDGYTKADLIQYYHDVSPYLLPHLRGRPFVMSRYPNGINEEFFYQKDCPDYAPEWMETFPIYTENKGKDVHYIVCNNVETLLWLANQACIEMHPWLAKTEDIKCPDIAVFDLDPMPPLDFKATLEIAPLVREALKEFGIKGYPKTSGSTGVHVYVPLKPEHTYQEVKEFVHYVCSFIHQVYPQKTTMERLIENRTGKIYLDYLQNTSGKTMACQYSLRPHKGAPVSTPLTWDEVEKGQIRPEDFNIKTALKRFRERGDLYQEMLTNRQSLKKVLALV